MVACNRMLIAAQKTIAPTCLLFVTQANEPFMSWLVKMSSTPDADVVHFICLIACLTLSPPYPGCYNSSNKYKNNSKQGKNTRP